MKMETEERIELERIERAIRTLIYGANKEFYQEAKERGVFVLEFILGVFPVGIFKQYPELEAIYKKMGGWTMKIGERIFYTGDIANVEGWGAITDMKDDQWGLRYTITLKDGRVFPSIFPAMFEKSVGQRFKTENQVKQEQAERLRRFERLYGKKEGKQ